MALVALGKKAPEIASKLHLSVHTVRKWRQYLVFQNDKELVLHRMPIKGMTKERLMGNMASLALFPSLQLELPFHWEAQKTNTTFWDSD